MHRSLEVVIFLVMMNQGNQVAWKNRIVKNILDDKKFWIGITLISLSEGELGELLVWHGAQKSQFGKVEG